MTTRILRGHALDRLAELPDESVHCAVTSPPYFGLRDYGIEPQVWHAFNGNPDLAYPECEMGHDWGTEGKSEQRLRNGISSDTAKVAFAETLHPSTGAHCRHCNAWRGDLGMEPSPELYIAHLVEVFREVRRVLRKDGTLWLNIGDSYAGSWGAQSRKETPAGFHGNQINNHPKKASRTGSIRSAGLKPKDLIGVPWMLAFALRADGWWLRSEIIWAKKAPMPESVTDRPTSATEKVFLLTKSARYFYDAEAVKEMADGAHTHGANATSVPGRSDQGCNLGRVWGGDKRNMRNWWLLGPEPFPEAHFATFPTEIPRICIKAGTSERGVCPKCGAPWYRIIKKSGGTIGKGGWESDPNKGGRLKKIDGKLLHREEDYSVETIGWHATCSCEAEHPMPATVIDPFLGAGTTSLVADQLGRDCIGIELNTEYAQMAERRLRDDAGMFAQVGE